MYLKNFAFALLFLMNCSNNSNSSDNSKETTDIRKDYTSYHTEAMEFVKSKGFSEDYYILIDLSLHSGKNRFFVYDFNDEKFIYQKLVTHGSCDIFEENPEKWTKVKFSNKDGSHCSSKGKYKIGNRDYSSWGIKVKYWLHGLETSNSNAVERVVVLHSWEAVKDNEIFPNVSPLSWGCPAVSNEFMKVLDEKLKATQKPVLLWIVD